jgi:hypothetical protein
MTGTNYTFIDFVKYLTRKYCTGCVSTTTSLVTGHVVASTQQSPLVDCAELKEPPCVQTHCHPLTSLYLPVKFLGSEQR